MSQWLRWQFVLPRLLLCVVAGLAAQFTADLIVRELATQSATTLVGAPVEITNARISPTDGRIHLGGLTIADPRCPSRPWMAADSCEFELQLSPLSRKQTVFEKARISGLRMNAPAACDSHADVDPSNSLKLSAAQYFDEALAKAAGEQLAKIKARFDEDLVTDLDSVKRATALQASLPNELAALEGRATELQRQAEELEKVLSAANSNQLRHDRTVESLPGKVANLRKDFDALGFEFDQIPQRLENERRKIIAARRTDEQQLTTRLRVDRVDANAMNAYLLGEQATQPFDDVVSWIKCINQFASTTRKRGGAQRGEDIAFAGLRPTTSFLIRTLELQGEGSFAGQSIPIRGQITNISTTPALLAEPVCVRFSANGTASMELRATIDRTNGRACDELFVECRDLRWAAQSLGSADQLQVRLSPSNASLLVSLRVESNSMTGDVQWVQKDVAISTAAAGELSGLPLSDPLDASLRNVTSFATRVTVSGTLDRPNCTVWSNLGAAVVEGVDRAVAKHAEEHSRTVLDEARRVVDERLATLERQVSDTQAHFARIATGMPARLDQIARNRTRRERISVERIGRRLPDNSILR